MAQRQFGRLRPELDYRDRPSAYGLLERDGLIAMVRVTFPGQAAFYDLPGGGIDVGETGPQALVREFGEETGLAIAPGALISSGDQYMINADEEAFNSLGDFYVVSLEAERPDLQVEDDHELVWRRPDEALVLLRHDSHAWAVTAWLRRQGRTNSDPV